MTWMGNTESSGRLPLKTSPFFIILFYFPCLFVWCWKSLWKPPPPAEAVVKCWWNPAQQPLAHLFSFNFLSRGMRGQEEHQLSGFSPLFKPSLPNLFVLPSVYLCSLSQETAFYLTICLKVITQPEFLGLMRWRLFWARFERFGLRKI